MPKWSNRLCETFPRWIWKELKRNSLCPLVHERCHHSYVTPDSAWELGKKQELPSSPTVTPRFSSHHALHREKWGFRINTFISADSQEKYFRGVSSKEIVSSRYLDGLAPEGRRLGLHPWSASAQDVPGVGKWGWILCFILISFVLFSLWNT